MFQTGSNHFFNHLRTRNSEVKSPIWPEFELVRDFMPVQSSYLHKSGRKSNPSEFYSCPRYIQLQFGIHPIKMKVLSSIQYVPRYKAFGCHAMATSFHSICPLNLMQPFPYPSDAIHILIKTGQLALEIFKFEIMDDDGRRRRMDYKVNLWGS